jgi:hypothetical protein
MTSNILQNLIVQISDIASLNKKNTGPTIREKDQNLTVSYNIYNNLSVNWAKLTKLLELIFEGKNLIPKGEVITHLGSGGKIIDSGLRSFEVVRSKIWECYFYDPEEFMYVRALWERDLQKKDKVTDLDLEWISVDIDLVRDSAWFSEESRKQL